jgi:hypothetical protein
MSRIGPTEERHVATIPVRLVEAVSRDRESLVEVIAHGEAAGCRLIFVRTRSGAAVEVLAGGRVSRLSLQRLLDDVEVAIGADLAAEGP